MNRRRIAYKRNELNEALYFALDASSKNDYFDLCEKRVSRLRAELHEAMRAYWCPEPVRGCDYCGDPLQSFEFDICTACMKHEEEQGSYCEICGSETEEDGADYCNVCWDDAMKQDEEEAA